MIPGEVWTPDEPVELDAGGDRVELTVENGGHRPIQAGSLYHFTEANPALASVRDAAHRRARWCACSGSAGRRIQHLR